MQIECVLKRDGGTKITLGATLYYFQPQADGAQVAAVDDDEHIERLLAIPEGYRIYRGGKDNPAEKSKGAGPAPKVVLLGSSVHPATFDINGATHALGDVVAAAHTESGLSAEDWNALDENARHDLIDAALDKLSQAEPPVPPKPEAKPATKSTKKK